jgi:ribosomal protein L29
LKETKDMVLSLSLEKEQNKLKNTSMLSLKRKEIAVIKTIMKVKEEKK